MHLRTLRPPRLRPTSYTTLRPIQSITGLLPSCQPFTRTPNRPSIPRPTIRTFTSTPQALSALQKPQPSLLEHLTAQPTFVPSEKEVLAALKSIRDNALTRRKESLTAAKKAVAVQGMLDPPRVRMLPPPVNPRAVEAAYQIVTAPGVFISPVVLAAYTDLVIELNEPDSLAEVFHLYANKPVVSTRGVKEQNPDSVKNMIPKALATRALDAAIAKGEMTLVLDIIDQSFAREPMRWNRILRKVSPAVAGGALLPPLGWYLAERFAWLQETSDVDEATGVAFWAIMGYFFCTGSLGLIAIAVANDQMLRITWEKGTGLFWRWSREEERAVLDKVAMAWGFQEKHKWGAEEGADWELLREWCARREMVLDDPALMEGMN